MPARNRPGLSENTRLRIKTTKIVQRLHDFVYGKVEMSPAQVRAAEVLLNKTLPNLQAIEVDLTGDNVQRVINAQPMTADEWTTEYSLESPGGTPESVN